MRLIDTQHEMTSKLPAHQVAYDQLRQGLLFGDFQPGAALTIHGLVAHFGTGMTPVREALRRLTAEGAVETLDNRRLIVPILSEEEIQDIVFARLSVEPELLERAVGKLNDADVDMLEDLDSAINEAIKTGDVRAYLRNNYTFHTRLYATANAPILSRIVDQLWVRFGPSLRVVCGRFGTMNLPDRHLEILSALKSGNAVLARDALKDDIRQGMDMVLKFRDTSPDV